MDNIAALPELLAHTGLDQSDRDAILEFLMEISGARIAVDNTIQLLKNNVDIRQRLDDDDYADLWSTSNDDIDWRANISAATDRVDDAFNRLTKSYTREQIDHLDNIGYAFLDRDQLDIFYGRDGIYNYTSFSIDLDDYGNWTDADRESALHHTVAQLAVSTDASVEEQFRAWQTSRLKQTTLAPFAFGPAFETSTILGMW